MPRGGKKGNKGNPKGYTGTYRISQAERLKRRFVEALKETMGIFGLAAEKVNVPRSTFYLWMKKDPAFNQAVRDIEEDRTDFVESKLLNNINDGKENSITYYLDRKGRKRGYGPKEQIDLNISPETESEIPEENFTDEELEIIAEQEENARRRFERTQGPEA